MEKFIFLFNFYSNSIKRMVVNRNSALNVHHLVKITGISSLI